MCDEALPNTTEELSFNTNLDFADECIETEAPNIPVRSSIQCQSKAKNTIPLNDKNGNILTCFSLVIICYII